MLNVIFKFKKTLIFLSLLGVEFSAKTIIITDEIDLKIAAQTLKNEFLMLQNSREKQMLAEIFSISKINVEFLKQLDQNHQALLLAQNKLEELFQETKIIDQSNVGSKTYTTLQAIITALSTGIKLFFNIFKNEKPLY